MGTDNDNAANNNTDGQGTQNNQGTQPAADGQGTQNGQQQNGQPAQNNQPAQGNQQAANNQQQDEPKGTLLGGETKPAAPAGAPEQYDYTAAITEGMQVDQQLADGFSVIAREMNLTNDQANKIAAYGIQYGQQVAQAMQQQLDAEVAGWGEAAKKELGADFDKTMQLCGAALEAVEKQVPGIRKALNETGAGNRIEVIKVMRLMGELVQSDPGKLANLGGAAKPAGSDTWYNNSKM